MTVMVIQAECFACGRVDKVEVDEANVREHLEGALVQDAFPLLSPQEREVLIAHRIEVSGGSPTYLCQSEWDEM